MLLKGLHEGQHGFGDSAKTFPQPERIASGQGKARLDSRIGAALRNFLSAYISAAIIR